MVNVQAAIAFTARQKDLGHLDRAVHYLAPVAMIINILDAKLILYLPRYNRYVKPKPKEIDVGTFFVVCSFQMNKTKKTFENSQNINDFLRKS